MKNNHEKKLNSVRLTNEANNILPGNFKGKDIASTVQADVEPNQKMTPEERDIHIVQTWIP